MRPIPFINNNCSQESSLVFYDTCTYLDMSDDLITNIKGKYREEHRHYHTLDHIAQIIKLIQKAKFTNTVVEDALLYAAIFHDVIYDPKSKTNEIDSVTFMWECLKDVEMEYILKDAEKMILATQTHSNFTNELERTFCQFDLYSFEQSFESILNDERKIRKEYEWVDWDIYQSSRIPILEKFATNELLSDKAKQNILFETEYLKFCIPNIAVYPGSFNPLHVGHLNILEKAEKIFDKVILAVGHNPEKSYKAHIFHENMCETLKYRQVDFYEGLLTDYIKSKQYSVTVIRGLRNTTDMMAEVNQLRWLQDLSDNQIKMVSIFCDKEYEHISSSAIRSIEEYDQEFYQKYIVK